jgi:hypothetical protein
MMRMNIYSNDLKQPRFKPELLIVGQATIDDINREGEGLVTERIPGGDSIVECFLAEDELLSKSFSQP